MDSTRYGDGKNGMSLLNSLSETIIKAKEDEDKTNLCIETLKEITDGGEIKQRFLEPKDNSKQYITENIIFESPKMKFVDIPFNSTYIGPE